jgi:hypothetical protein
MTLPVAATPAQAAAASSSWLPIAAIFIGGFFLVKALG